MNKETISRAVRLYFTTYLAAVMGVFIYLSVGVLVSVAFPEGQTLSNVTSVVMNAIALFLQGGLFFVIVYGKQWDYGDKDSNAALFGHIEGDRWRGLKMGLLAAIPSFAAWLVLVADKLFSFWPYTAAVYRVCQLPLYPVLVWSMGSNIMATTATISWGGILCAGLPVLFVPVVATIAYVLGFRHIQVWERIVFSRKKK